MQGNSEHERQTFQKVKVATCVLINGRKGKEEEIWSSPRTENGNCSSALWNLRYSSLIIKWASLPGFGFNVKRLSLSLKDFWDHDGWTWSSAPHTNFDFVEMEVVSSRGRMTLSTCPVNSSLPPPSSLLPPPPPLSFLWPLISLRYPHRTLYFYPSLCDLFKIQISQCLSSLCPK